jgi:4-amino-4-deoxy-L-arabinose transferase-like glycosyltransferase
VNRWRAAWAARHAAATRESLWLACWVVVPLVLLTLNRSELPQYVLPLMPAVALAAARTLTTTGATAAWRRYATIATLLGAVFILVPGRIGSPVSLTAAERATMVPTGIAVGSALLVSVAGIVLAARRQDVRLAALAYAAIIVTLPFSTAALMRAVGDDRSAARLAAGVTAALEPAGPGRDPVAVLGVAAYPPSLPFYLGKPIAVATATADELTSNYIVAYQERYRSVPNSPLKAIGFWQTMLAQCPTPTVFVTRAGNREAREALATLPFLVEDQHYAAYGPCHAPAPLARNAASLSVAPANRGGAAGE